MNKLRLLTLGMMVACASVLTTLRTAHAQDETAESAVWLLKKSTLVHRNGMHNILLRAMRQLHDPSLEPLFSALVQKRHPVLKIHGIMGLGEISSEKVIDLKLVADLKDPGTQAQLLSSAIEGDLLNEKQAKELMTWPGLDLPVKIIVAAKLVSQNKLTTPAEKKVLEEGVNSDNPAVKAMAALMKMQIGDRSAMASLEELENGDEIESKNVRIMVLQSAMRYEFDSIAPLAMKWATAPTGDPALSFLALRTALRFGAPDAASTWTQRYHSTDSLAERIRLAILVLDLADNLNPSVFDVLINDDKLEIVQMIGRAGKKVASKQDPTADVVALLDDNNLLVTKWVFQYARDVPIDRGETVLLEIIKNAEGGDNPSRFRGERLENVVLATEHLAENSPDAKMLINDVIRKVPQLSQEAILMGLIRSEAVRPHSYVDGVTEWQGETAEALALLLRGKHGVAFDQPMIDRLALIVRGGAGLQDPLRAQAAWVYLKKTNQERFALANVLGN